MMAAVERYRAVRCSGLTRRTGFVAGQLFRPFDQVRFRCAMRWRRSESSEISGGAGRSSGGRCDRSVVPPALVTAARPVELASSETPCPAAVVSTHSKNARGGAVEQVANTVLEGAYVVAGPEVAGTDLPAPAAAGPFAEFGIFWQVAVTDRVLGGEPPR